MRIEVTEHYALWYGSTWIEFAVIRRDRKSLEIAVRPDGGVKVTAPRAYGAEAIREKVKTRAGWIVKQRNWFKQFESKTPVHQYLGGETHLYLGKKYRLKISAGKQNRVRLTHGHFEVTIKGDVSSEAVRSQLELWYRKQAGKLFNALFQELCALFGVSQIPKLQLRAMKTRWGSFSQRGILTLNSSLIQAPKDCISYVITHELCHMAHHNHGTDFYKLLAKRWPDWEKCKQKLEEALIKT